MKKNNSFKTFSILALSCHFCAASQQFQSIAHLINNDERDTVSAPVTFSTQREMVDFGYHVNTLANNGDYATVLDLIRERPRHPAGILEIGNIECYQYSLAYAGSLSHLAIMNKIPDFNTKQEHCRNAIAAIETYQKAYASIQCNPTTRSSIDTHLTHLSAIATGAYYDMIKLFNTNTDIPRDIIHQLAYKGLKCGEFYLKQLKIEKEKNTAFDAIQDLVPTIKFNLISFYFTEYQLCCDKNLLDIAMSYEKRILALHKQLKGTAEHSQSKELIQALTHFKQSRVTHDKHAPLATYKNIRSAEAGLALAECTREHDATLNESIVQENQKFIALVNIAVQRIQHDQKKKGEITKEKAADYFSDIVDQISRIDAMITSESHKQFFEYTPEETSHIFRQYRQIMGLDQFNVFLRSTIMVLIYTNNADNAIVRIQAAEEILTERDEACDPFNRCLIAFAKNIEGNPQEWDTLVAEAESMAAAQKAQMTIEKKEKHADFVESIRLTHTSETQAAAEFTTPPTQTPLETQAAAEFTKKKSKKKK